MKQRARVAVVGSANIDLVVRTPRMPAKGETILGGPFFSGQGGKGANQAVSAARLGAAVEMVARLGRDEFGEMVAANLAGEGIGLDSVLRSADVHTGVAFIIVDAEGENMIVVASGANAELSPDDVAAAREAVLDAQLVVLQLESPMETVRYTAGLAHNAGVKVLLNPAPGRALDEALLRDIDVLTPNQTEARLITGVDAATPEQAERAARRLLQKGVGTVIVTLGADGALAVSKAASGEAWAHHVPGYQVDVVDTTGAGDAFNGALAVALAEDQPLLEAVRFANAAAALQVTRQGAAPAMPTREEVETFLAAQD
ncbi:MAG: ribokinase [Anaerolineae bacterium]